MGAAPAEFQIDIIFMMQCALYTSNETCPGPVVDKSAIRLDLVQGNMCDAHTNIVNHSCGDHCIIKDDFDLKFCRNSRDVGVAHSWGLCTLVVGVLIQMAQ